MDQLVLRIDSNARQCYISHYKYQIHWSRIESLFVFIADSQPMGFLNLDLDTVSPKSPSSIFITHPKGNKIVPVFSYYLQKINQTTVI